jgi:hypothetical protein
MKLITVSPLRSYSISNQTFRIVFRVCENSNEKRHRKFSIIDQVFVEGTENNMSMWNW